MPYGKVAGAVIACLLVNSAALAKDLQDPVVMGSPQSATGEPIEQARSNQPRAQIGQEESSNQSENRSLLALEKAIQALVSKISPPKEDQTKAAEEEKRANEDLKAQQDMAFWAFLMLVATVIQIVMNGAGIWLVWQSLKAARASVDRAADGAEAAKRSVEISEQALVATERAFVYLEKITENPVKSKDNTTNVAWVFWFPWHNSGSTPALLAEGHVNTLSYTGLAVLPYWYPLMEVPTQNARFFLGPQETRSVGPVRIPIEQMMNVYNNTGRLYFHGWIKYRDVFNVPHITRFCIELANLSEDPSKIDMPIHISYSHWVRNNCADSQCDEEMKNAMKAMPPEIAEMYAKAEAEFGPRPT